jgi:hypothetical protein
MLPPLGILSLLLAFVCGGENVATAPFHITPIKVVDYDSFFLVLIDFYIFVEESFDLEVGLAISANIRQKFVAIVADQGINRKLFKT